MSGAPPEVAPSLSVCVTSRVRSEPIPRRQPPVRLPRPLVGGACPVAAWHRPRPPAGQAHQTHWTGLWTVGRASRGTGLVLCTARPCRGQLIGGGSGGLPPRRGASGPGLRGG